MTTHKNAVPFLHVPFVTYYHHEVENTSTKMEKCAMEEASTSQLSNWTTTTWCRKVNKWTYGVRVLRLCGFKSLQFNTYKGMMLSKNHNKNYPLASTNRQVSLSVLLLHRSSKRCWYTKGVAYHQVESNPGNQIDVKTGIQLRSTEIDSRRERETLEL